MITMAFMDSFKRALAFTLANESGYANDANDRGGATMMVMIMSKIV